MYIEDMEQHHEELTGYHVRRAARLLGMMQARAGDCYDVAEEFAIGYAIGALASDPEAQESAYTTGPQAGGNGVEDGETVFTADQEEEAPPTVANLRLQLIALNGLQAAIRSVISWRVDDMRAGGASWAAVGEALEISAQGAQQRFGKVFRGGLPSPELPGQSALL